MILNMTGGSSNGTGATLVVNTVAGVTVTITKDGKDKVKIADSLGIAVFKGLETGEWTIVITDGERVSPTKTVTITADYETAITFFSATIHITYPAGSTCTATDGVTTIHAPDTSGTWDCVVPNAGTWTVSNDGNGLTQDVTITDNGQEVTIDLTKVYIIKDGVPQNGYTFEHPMKANNEAVMSVSSDGTYYIFAGGFSGRTSGIRTDKALPLGKKWNYLVSEGYGTSSGDTVTFGAARAGTSDNPLNLYTSYASTPTSIGTTKIDVSSIDANNLYAAVVARSTNVAYIKNMYLE